MLQDKIMDMFFKGESQMAIAKHFRVSISHISKTISKEIEEGDYIELSREYQIKLIEIKLFKLIDKYHATNNFRLLDEIKSLQNTYSTFTI